MSESDKRKTQRRLADYVVEFYDLEGSFLMGVGRLLDLSASGALVESTLRLTEGQRLWVQLRRGDHSNLELPVTIMRVRSKGSALTYGLQFNRAG